MSLKLTMGTEKQKIKFLMREGQRTEVIREKKAIKQKKGQAAFNTIDIWGGDTGVNNVDELLSQLKWTASSKEL